MKLTIKNGLGLNKVVDLNKNLEFNVSKGEQYIFSSGFSNYILNFEDNQESILLVFNVDGKSIQVQLKGIVPLLQENTPNMQNPTAVIINKNISDKDVDNIVDNSEFSGSEIIDRLEAIMSRPVDGGDGTGENLALITDFQTLLDSLGAAAAGPAGGDAAGNGSTFNSIFGPISDQLNGIAPSDVWENLSESITSLPVDPGDETGANTVTIPGIYVTGQTVNEADGTITFTISLTEATTQTVTVDFTTIDGTAIAGSDYESLSGTVTFVPGEITKTVTVTVLDDSAYEPQEYLTLELSNSLNATINIESTEGVILDDDSKPEIVVSDSSVNEEDGVLTFTISLSNPSSETVSVDYVTVDGTAVAVEDYLSESGTITFEPGETSKIITVVVVNDDVYEDSESMYVNLSNPVNAEIADEQGEGRIQDEADKPELTVSNTEVVEGEYAVFNIQLSNPSEEDVTFDLLPKEDSATEDDYTPVVEVSYDGGVTWEEATEGTIPAGQTEILARVKTTQDDIDEPVEEFKLEATVTSGNTINEVTEGTASILDNDGIPQIVISDSAINEEDGVLTFTISLSNPSSETVSVDYVTVDGTAVAVEDYLSESGTITFEPGETSKIITVVVVNDDVYEDSESMYVNLSNPVNAEIADEQGEGRIQDEADKPELTVSNTEVVEGEYAVFNIQLSNPSEEDVTFDLLPKEDSATEDDYTPVVEVSYDGGVTWEEATEGTIPAGQTEILARVKTTQDDIDEPVEEFKLEATVTSGNTINEVTEGTASILDNDGIPQIVISDSAINEEDGVLTFTISLSNPSSETVSVDYVTVDGTAVAVEDYLSESGTITFEPGETSKIITVVVVNDDVYEDSESMYVNLSNPVNAEIADEQGEGRIQDEADKPELTVSNTEVVEGEYAVFNIQLSNPSEEDVTFDLLPKEDSATEDDYTPVVEVSYDGGVTWEEATEGTIPAGQTEILARVKTTQDDIDEPVEEFKLEATVTSGNTINEVTEGTASILDNDGIPQIVISDSAINEEDGVLTFTISLSNPSSETVSVDYVTVDGTAVAVEDYLSESGIITFEPGETSKIITVVVVNDDVYEDSESMYVNLSNPVNAEIADEQGEGRIQDEADKPELTVSNTEVVEGEYAVFNIQLSNPSEEDVTFDLLPKEDSATEDDYTPVVEVSYDGGVTWEEATEGTIPAGQTEILARVKTTQDDIDEPVEEFKLEATVTSGNTINEVTEGTASILDNDGIPQIVISDSAINEEDGVLTFTISLSNPSSETVSVDYVTVDGTAVAVEDYLSESGTITFEPGETSKIITVVVVNDDVYEDSESMYVNLSNPVNAEIADEQGEGRIQDEADKPELTVSNTEVVEGEYAVFNIQLSNPSEEDVTFDLLPKEDSATEDDYTPVVEVSYDGGVTWEEATEGTIPAGQTEILARVKTTQDDIDEPVEEFKLEATVTSGNTINEVTEGTASILDNDGIPQIVISDSAINEEDGVLTFTISLSNPSSETVSVDYVTVDGTAVAVEDYLSESGTITFEPGETSKIITVVVVNDDVYEDSESMYVNLSNPVNAEIADEQGEGRIQDEADKPELTVSNTEVVEGEYAVFNIQLSNPSEEDVTFDLLPKEDSATEDDYTPVVEVSYDGGVTWEEATEGTIPAGQTEILARVKTTQDDIDEPVEEFKLEATVTSGNTINEVTEGTASILDNDGIPQIVISDSAINEEDGVLTFTISLSNPSSETVSVDYVTVDGTAVAVEDYLSESGTITFEPGETSKIITVVVVNDDVYEDSESMYVNLSNPVNAEIADEQGEGRINDEGEEGDIPTLSISDSVVTEGDYNVFTVQISNPSTEDIKFEFSTTDVTATTNDDYRPDLMETYEVSNDGGITWTPSTGGVIEAGNTAILVRIPTVEDDVSEDTETYTLTATVTEGTTTNSTYPTGLNATGTGTILDDDGVPTILIGDAVVNEEDGTITFKVSLTNPSSEEVTVDFVTVDGTAVAGEDYTATSGTITFPVDTTVQYITVPVLDDNIYELDESFTVELSNPTNASIDDEEGEGVIKDNDLPQLSITDVSTTEGDYAEFVISISNPSDEDIVLALTTNEDSATEGEDYSPEIEVLVNGVWTPATEATIPAGENQVIARVKTEEDDISEGNEKFTLTATVLEGTTSNDEVTGEATILDDDGVPTILIGDAVVNEEDGTITFKVSLTNPSSEEVTVDFVTVDGTAVAGEDYTATSGTITFPVDTTVQYITVPVLDDNIYELDESFTVELSNPTNASIDDEEGEGVIKDNDLPQLSITDVSTTEGDYAEFVISISNPSDEDIVLALTTNEDSATEGEDYSPEIEVLVNGVWTPATEATIPAGENQVIARVKTEEDDISEGNEKFTLTATVLEGTTSNDEVTGEATILDDDGVPTILIGDAVVNEEDGTITFKVSLTNPSSEEVTVDFVTVDGTAVAGEDYTATSGTITFPVDTTVQYITVPVLDDNIYELDESFTVELSNPTNASIDDEEGEGVIKDNDLPQLSITDVSTTEGDYAEFVISISNPSDEDIVLALTTNEDSATEGEDYSPEIEVLVNGVWTPATEATIPAGENQVIARVKTEEDDISEGNEKFTLTATVLEGTTSNDEVTGEATILDDDGVPTILIGDAVVNEEDGTITFKVSLTNPSSEEVTVDFVTVDGTAVAGEDYTATSGTITFPVDTTVQYITVPVLDDNIYELDESFTVELSNPTNASIDDEEGEGVIKDNDLPQLSITDVSTTEGDYAEFVISISNPSDEDIVLALTTNEDSATEGEDYSPEIEVLVNGVWTPATEATIPAGENQVIARVKTEEDDISEGNEKFTLTATVLEGTTSNDEVTGEATILDDDGVPTILIGDAVVNEEDGTITFKVSLTNPSSEEVTVDFVTVDGTAVAGEDYVYKMDTIEFAAGETSKTITIEIIDDLIYEFDENFTIQLSNPVNAEIADDQGVGTIKDNEEQPEVYITTEDPSITEGEDAVFLIKIDTPASEDIVVKFTISGDVDNDDYVEPTVYEVTIKAGETEVELPIETIIDGKYEGTEDITVELEEVTGANSVLDATRDDATVEINDSLDAPKVSILTDQSEIPEGTTAEFVVKIDTPADEDITVTFTITGDVDSDDIRAEVSPVTYTIIIPAGMTEVPLDIKTINDLVFEDTEDLVVNLLGTVGADSSIEVDTAKVAILDDDLMDESEVKTIKEDEILTGNVLDNAVDNNGDTITVTEFSVDTNNDGIPETFAPGETATIDGVGTITIGEDGEFTFTPEDNYNGDVPTIAYKVTDGTTVVDSTLSIEVTPVDDVLTDASETLTVKEDTPLSGNVLDNAEDLDGDTITVTEFSVDTNNDGIPETFAPGETADIPGVGTITIGEDGEFTFTPEDNYNGDVPTIAYKVTDGTTVVDSTLSIEVTPVDDVLTDASETLTVKEDTPLSGNVLDNAEDLDGDTITVTEFSVDTNNDGIPETFAPGETADIPGVGTITIGEDGEFTFTPEDNYNGDVPTIAYKVTDGTTVVDSTLSIEVTPVDDVLTDASETLTVKEDTPLSGNVLDNAEDLDGDTITVTEFSVDTNNDGIPETFAPGETADIPGVGTITIGEDGEFTFTPEDNYNGDVPTIAYKVTDGTTVVDSTLSIEVTPVDDVLTDASETLTVKEDTPLSGNVLDNAEDLDGDTITVTEFSVDTNNDGIPETFAPGETADIPGVGTITIGEDGEFTFTPEDNYNGDVPTIAYKVTDGTTVVDSTLSIEVTPVDDAKDVEFTAKEEGSEWVNNTLVTNSPTEGYDVSGNVFASNTSAVNATVTAIIVAGVEYAVAQDGTDTVITTDSGTLTIDSTGEFTYDVNETYTESMNEGDSIADTFTYVVGNDSNDTATLTINIEGTDDAPTINSIDVNDQAYKVIDGLLDVNQDGIADTIDPSQLLAHDSDEYFSADNGNITIDLGSGGTDMAVEYLGGQASYNNVIGFYEYDDNGNPTNPVIIHIEDKDFVGENYEFLGTLDDLEGKVGFFIIPNGAGIVDTNTTLTFDGNTLQADGVDLTDVYYTDNNLSTDGKDHAIIAQDVDGTGLVIAFEDLSLGDQDYDDVVIKIKPCLSTDTEVVTQNLVVNGSFEDVSGVDRFGNVLDDKTIANGDWIGMKTLTGWELLSSESRWMEVHDGDHAGVGTTDGDNYFDMGESSTISGDKDCDYNANTHIGQVISGVETGNTYELSFDYRDKAAMQEDGISGENSGVVEVYWGGELIATIQGNNTDAWETFNIEVIGGAGDGSNRLEFKEVGEGYDNWGIALDNISLVGTQVVETEMNIINDINISDVDDAYLESATVTLTNYKAGDVIEANSLPSGITATITEVNGELVVTLSGTATVADYEAAIESLTFESSSEDRTPRDFEIVVNDGDKDSNTMAFSLNIGGCTLNTDVDDSISAQVSIVDGSDANSVIDASTGSVEAATITGRIDYGDTITKLVITDGVNEYVIDPTTVVVQPNGTFTITNVDVSSLTDGTLTVELNVKDNAGNTASDTDTVEKDTIAEISITSTDLSTSNVATVSGNVSDVEDGQTVTVTLTDEHNQSITVTTTVKNGVWTIAQDISSLNGDLTISATVEDLAGNLGTTTGTIEGINSIPESTDDEISTCEDVQKVLTLNDFGNYSDSNDDVLSSVKIESLPINGVLLLSGIAVVAGQEISATEIASGNLVFVPSDNTDLDSQFTFRVSDGTDLSSSVYTTTVNVLAVADAPTLVVSLSEARIIETTEQNVCTASQDLSELIAYVEGNSITEASEIIQISSQDDYNVELSTLTDGDLLVYDNPTNQNDTRVLNDVVISNTDSTLDLSNTTVITNTINNTYQMTENQLIFEGDIVQNGNVIGTSSNDVIIVKGEIQGGSNINAGLGDDVIAIFGDIGAYQPAVNGDDGFDILYLSKPASAYEFLDIHYHDNLDGHILDKETGNVLTFNNIEGIAFGDGTGLNCEFNSTTVTSYEYDLDISSSLVDRDGSESLSIVIEGLPDGAVLSEGTKNSDGTWTITTDNLDYTSSNLKVTVPEGSTDFNINVVATATEGAIDSDVCVKVAETALEVSAGIPDTVPTSVSEAQTITFEANTAVDTNIVITLDISGSMDDNKECVDRLALAKVTLENIIKQYDNAGDVNVKLITFNEQGCATGWMSASQAINYINSLQAVGWTNYEDALYETYHNYTEPVADQTVAYFISDGEPTKENIEGCDNKYTEGLDSEAGWVDSAYVNAWNTFVDTYVDQLNVVAMGTGIDDTTYLDLIAGVADGDFANTLVVRDSNDLNATLLNTVNVIETKVVTGNLLDNVDFNTDGAGGIVSIQIDGTVYTASTYPSDGVTTSNGGLLEFNFTSGDYKYTAVESNYSSDISEVFNLVAIDSDDDTTTYSLTINVDVVEAPAKSEIVIENSETIFEANFDGCDAGGWYWNKVSGCESSCDERTFKDVDCDGDKELYLKDYDTARGFAAQTLSGSLGLTTYAISVDVNTKPNGTDYMNNDVGIVFGYTDDSNYYRVEWKDFDDTYCSYDTYRDFSIVKVENGVETVLATENQLDVYAMTGSQFNLEVSVDEDGISASIDGNEIISTSAEQPAMGTFGLWTNDNDSGVAYDNVKVEATTKTIIEENVDLSLEDIIANHIDDADVINLENGVANRLDIDMDDVIDLVDSDKELIIRGDLEDTVDLDATEWTNSGTEQLDGINYNVYNGTGTNSTIKILIEDDIDVTPDI